MVNLQPALDTARPVAARLAGGGVIVIAPPTSHRDRRCASLVAPGESQRAHVVEELQKAPLSAASPSRHWSA
jgi:hypothetical protein